MIKIEGLTYLWVCRYSDNIYVAATPEDECFRYCKGMCDIDGKVCVVREFVYNPKFRQKHSITANNYELIGNSYFEKVK